jgi:hypothetical protein
VAIVYSSTVLTEACTVIIAAADRLPQIKERVGDLDGEALDFTDVDALSALAAIVKRRPQLVVLERSFAATPRGAALINRIRADKKLAHTEIKVVAHDSDSVRVVPRSVGQPSQPLDQRGTRRSPRFRMATNTTATVDGKNASVIDLSVIGAQVVSPAAVKPRQTVEIVLFDKEGSVTVEATVAWTSYEIPPNSGPRYRAGVEFVEPVPPEVDAFCQRHKTA